MSSESEKQIAKLLELLKKAERETAKLEAAGQIGQGTIQTIGLVLNGVLNLIGKWIEAFGQAVVSPIGLPAFLIANVIALNYFAHTEPYKSILKQFKLLDLILALTGGTGSLPPPGVKPPAILPTVIKGEVYWVIIRYVGPYGPDEFIQWYSTIDLAQASANYYSSGTNNNFIVVAGPGGPCPDNKPPFPYACVPV